MFVGWCWLKLRVFANKSVGGEEMRRERLLIAKSIPTRQRRWKEGIRPKRGKIHRRMCMKECLARK